MKCELCLLCLVSANLYTGGLAEHVERKLLQTADQAPSLGPTASAATSPPFLRANAPEGAPAGEPAPIARESSPTAQDEAVTGLSSTPVSGAVPTRTSAPTAGSHGPVCPRTFGVRLPPGCPSVVPCLPTTQRAPDGRCVSCGDIENDPTNCGGSYGNTKVCAGTTNGVAQCDRGACGFACSPGYVLVNNACVVNDCRISSCTSPAGSSCLSVNGVYRCICSIAHPDLGQSEYGMIYNCGTCNNNCKDGQSCLPGQSGGTASAASA